MRPDTAFDFSKRNKTNLQALLRSSDANEGLNLAPSPRLKTLDIFAAAIVEGLQHAQLVSPNEDVVILEARRLLERCAREKAGLERVLQIINRRPGAT